jgi:hypothetical protein
MRAFLVALLLFTSSTALAAKPKVVVTEVKGSISFMVEGSIKNALKKQKSISLVPTQEWRGAEAKVSGGAIDGAAIDPVKVAAKLGVGAIIEATTERDGKGWAAEIRVVSAANGKVVKSWRAKAKEIRKLTTSIEKNLWKKLGSAIKSTAANAGAAPADEPDEVAAQEEEAEEEQAKKPVAAKTKPTESKPAVKPADEEEEEEAAKEPTKTPSEKEEEKPAVASTAYDPTLNTPRSRANTPLSIALGLTYFTRSLRYNDDLFGELRPYTLSGAPAPALAIYWYPGAHFATGLAANFGIGLHAEYALGLSSKDSQGREFSTSEMELEGAARARIPLGDHEIALSAGAGIHSFGIDNAEGDVDPDVPAVNYTFLRFGLEASIGILDSLHLMVGGAYRPVLSAGEIMESAWFTRGSAAAVDASVQFAWEFMPGLDLRVGGEMKRYFYSLNPEPGDVRVAGGALDQYFSGTLAIGWHLR